MRKPKLKRNLKWLELSMSGWSEYKIARKFRVTPPRVHIVIKREKAKLKEGEKIITYGA